MSNNRLQIALSEAGITVERLADLTGVDLKTAQRWLHGRTPYTKHRLAIAEALGKTEAELWPDAAPRPRPEGSTSELEGAWISDSVPGAPAWQKLLAKATETIELCDYTLINIIETPGATSLLTNKAATGTTIRLLIASPDGAWLALDDWPPSMKQQIAAQGPIMQALRQAHQRLGALAQNSKVQARQALLPRSPVVFRLDEDMLVAIPLWGSQRPGAPLLHLKRRQQNGIFDRFTQHFNALWEESHTIDPDAGENPGWPRHTSPGTPADADPWPEAYPDQTEPIRRPRLTPYGRRPPRRWH